ncbi:MAG TPA: CAP domain-containing protein [Solirubrobacteraceae bacterium]|nr:CAP domain-containing protein [Solirubrobacteraceae bacterium]
MLLLAVGAFALPTGEAAVSVAQTPRAVAAASACAGEGSSPNGRNAALIDAAALCLMNQIRAAHSLPALHFNASLGRIASGQASDMVRGHYFGDQSLSGQSPLARIMASGYVLHPANIRLHAAQNIGWGTGHSATPAGIVRAWMESPPHRKIILTGAYRDAGVGVAPSVPSGFSGRWHGGTYAAEFGIRSR